MTTKEVGGPKNAGLPPSHSVLSALGVGGEGDTTHVHRKGGPGDMVQCDSACRTGVRT